MRIAGAHELPDELQPVMRRAIRVEWITLAYLVSAIALLYLTLGSSQAMKAAWIEDILTLLPPAAFLLAARFRHKPATELMPFGHHRAVSIAALIGNTAILALGSFLLLDSTMKLITAEHPSIGVVEIGDWQVWQGWVMIAALLYSSLPAIVLGRVLKPLASELHDKVLHGSAEMLRADWMTAFAACGGIVGIGFGLWWADAAAALVIALDIVKDGWRYVRGSVLDLMDRRPLTADEARPHPLKATIEDAIGEMEWVRCGLVRLRENGHVLAGQVWVVPAAEDGLVEKIEAAVEDLRALDWKLDDVVIVPVREIIDVPEGDEVVSGGAEAAADARGERGDLLGGRRS